MRKQRYFCARNIRCNTTRRLISRWSLEVLRSLDGYTGFSLPSFFVFIFPPSFIYFLFFLVSLSLAPSPSYPPFLLSSFLSSHSVLLVSFSSTPSTLSLTLPPSLPTFLPLPSSPHDGSPAQDVFHMINNRRVKNDSGSLQVLRPSIHHYDATQLR